MCRVECIGCEYHKFKGGICYCAPTNTKIDVNAVCGKWVFDMLGFPKRMMQTLQNNNP